MEDVTCIASDIEGTSRKKILIKEGFSAEKPVNSIIRFKIWGMRTPLSTKTSSSFRVATTDQDEYEIDAIDSGMTLTMIMAR